MHLVRIRQEGFVCRKCNRVLEIGEEAVSSVRRVALKYGVSARHADSHRVYRHKACYVSAKGEPLI